MAEMDLELLPDDFPRCDLDMDEVDLEKDTHVHALLYCPSTIQLWSNVEKWVRKDIQSHYKMCDWDKVFGNPKSSFIIKVTIFNTKKRIYMNRQIGKQMHFNFS